MNVEGREGNPERKRRAPCSVLNHKLSDQEDEGEDEEGYPGSIRQQVTNFVGDERRLAHYWH